MGLRSIVVFSIVFLFLGPSFGQENDFWYNIISTDNFCRYFIPNSDIGDDWKTFAFNDDSWTYAPSGIGFGDEDDNTVIASGVASVYLRYRFEISDLSAVKQLTLEMDYDDGFIAYLNGKEVARANVDDPVSWNMVLGENHEALLYQGLLPEQFILSSTAVETYLKQGTNVLAVEIHNVKPTSSDLSSNVFLQGEFTSEQSAYQEALFGSVKPKAFDSQLPIVYIDTNGKSIPDEPKISAQMTIYWQPGALNSTSDDSTNYSGHIGIEKRGNSSQSWPKKPYKVETRNSDGTNLNLSLIGLPQENDWVFHAPYVDKTLLRNALIYRLLNELGWYAPRYRFCELILNDDYQGVYVLIESLKVDKKRLDIAEASHTDLSGGYLLELTTSNRLSEDEPYITTAIADQVMAIKYPQDTSLTAAHKSYINGYLNDFEKALYDKSFSGAKDYKNYIDVPSFIDHMLVSEVVRQLDAFCASHHFYKDANGKLAMGPGWDYNRSIGNYKGHDEWEKTGFWMTATRGGCKPFWSWTIYEDESFMTPYRARYAQLRDNVLSTGHIYAIIDEYSQYIEQARERNFEVWDITENKAHKYVQGTYDGEINYVKEWLEERLNWLDDQWDVEAHPVINEFYPDGERSGVQWVELFNPYGRTVDVSHWQLHIGRQICTIPANTSIAANDYLVMASDLTRFKSKYPDVQNVRGGLQGDLLQDDVQLMLMDAHNVLQDSLNVSMSGAWPQLSQSGNYAVAMRSVSYNNAIGAYWNWSKAAGGTPAQKNEVYDYEGLIISEVMSANNSSIKDEYKQHDDWVELSNTSNYSINLNGLYLSDRLDKMGQWQIKDSLGLKNTGLAPGASVVLWLDNDAYRQGNLHANFEVNSAGERLLLSYFDGYNYKLIDQVYAPAMGPDYVFQLIDWSTQEWAVSNMPTPGRLDNNTSSINALASVGHCQMDLYPNPAKDFVTIDLNLNVAQSLSMRLLDVSGRELSVLMRTNALNQGHFTYRLALDPALTEGLYLLQVCGESFTETSPVIIAR